MRRQRIAGFVATAAIVGLSGLLATGQQRQTAESEKPGRIRTSLGEPDLQGIWSGETLTPMERPARFADKPVLAPEEAEALESEVAARPGRDDQSKKGSEKDVANAYNQHWLPSAQRLVDGRTSLVIDPPDGKIPPMTAEGQKRVAMVRDYLQALLQGTSGGRPGRPSPRRREPPPMYNVDRMNRSDGPEDRSTGERCFGGVPPYGAGAGSFFRIVQSPQQVAIYHDAQQGQGFVRVIPVDGSRHLPPHIGLYAGDSRGRWEGDTLVVDTTNFTFKTNYRGSRENLHVTERFTRVSDARISYRATLDDPTTWTRPWTYELPLERLADKPNQIYEATCHEGNYGLIGMLVNTRVSERLFKLGKGPDPATLDNATGGGGAGGID